VLQLWYIQVVPSTTTSVRLRDDLRDRLEETSRRVKKGKNWIITQALEVYLAKLDRKSIADEARRQSLVASAGRTEHADHWSSHTDDRGWK